MPKRSYEDVLGPRMKAIKGFKAIGNNLLRHTEEVQIPLAVVLQ